MSGIFSPKDTVEDFQKRFHELAKEAKVYGIDAMWSLGYDDRLGDDYFHLPGWTCGPIVAIGLCEVLKARALRDAVDCREVADED